jgi:hypothetical protein
MFRLQWNTLFLDSDPLLSKETLNEGLNVFDRSKKEILKTLLYSYRKIPCNYSVVALSSCLYVLFVALSVDSSDLFPFFGIFTARPTCR